MLMNKMDCSWQQQQKTQVKKNVLNKHLFLTNKQKSNAKYLVLFENCSQLYIEVYIYINIAKNKQQSYSILIDQALDLYSSMNRLISSLSFRLVDWWESYKCFKRDEK